MKKIFTLSFLLFGLVTFAQERVADVKTNTSTEQKGNDIAPPNTRNASTSAQVRTKEPVPLPYDVNDRYMGRKAEFLGNLIVTELPSDFPVYEKQWSLKEYNQVVTAFYYNHMDIVREGVRKKLELLEH